MADRARAEAVEALLEVLQAAVSTVTRDVWNGDIGAGAARG